MQEQINGCIKEQENYAIVKHMRNQFLGIFKNETIRLKVP